MGNRLLSMVFDHSFVMALVPKYDRGVETDQLGKCSPVASARKNAANVPRGIKPAKMAVFNGTAEAVPFQSRFLR